jgi:hypothetical protein
VGALATDGGAGVGAMATDGGAGGVTSLPPKLALRSSLCLHLWIENGEGQRRFASYIPWDLKSDWYYQPKLKGL